MKVEEMDQVPISLKGINGGQVLPIAAGQQQQPRFSVSQQQQPVASTHTYSYIYHWTWAWTIERMVHFGTSTISTSISTWTNANACNTKSTHRKRTIFSALTTFLTLMR